MNLNSLWPNYFGLTDDSTFLKVRKQFYPMFNHSLFSDETQTYLTFSEAKWFGIKLKTLLPFVAYEASAFLNPGAFNSEMILADWLQKLYSAKGWDLCSLSRLNSEQLRIIKKNLPFYLTQSRVQKIRALRLDPNNENDFKSYIKNRGFKFRKNYRYTQNALEKEGFAFSKLKSIEELFALYKKRNRVKDNSDYSIDLNFQNFLKELWKNLEGEKRLITVAIRHEEKIIAAVMAFSFQNVLQVYQIAYDPDYSHLNPGRNVLLKLIEENWSTGLHFVDFMSEWDYLESITDEYFEYHQVQLFAKNWRGQLLGAKASLR